VPESKPGTYALVLQSRTSTDIRIGRWGRLEIRPGYYIYVGSALGPGGVSARVSRHCREAKTRHWHIDYLREVTTPVSVWYSHDPIRLEHRWAETLLKMENTEAVTGFGCSDCRCRAHLFFTIHELDFASFAEAAHGCIEQWCCEVAG
jgi:Uri superfamily endonuclease